MNTCYIGKNQLGNWILCKNEVNSILKIDYYFHYLSQTIIVDKIMVADLGTMHYCETPKWLMEIIEEDFLIKSNK